MQIEENKTVDLPDENSGPSTEIDIADPSTESEIDNNNIEVSNETTTEDIVESKDSTEKSSEQSDVQTNEQKKEKELEQYSEGVQKRISKLTKKWREAERQKDEALTYAEKMMVAKKQADDKISKLEPGFMQSTEDSIVSGLESAKAKLTAAREAGDINAEVEAQTAISELAYKQAKFSETKAQHDEIAKKREVEVRTPEINLNRQQAARGTPDPKAEDWASKNSWFGQDTAMTYTAFDLHKKLTEQEGYDPQTNEYYLEIDKRIRLEFPHKFASISNSGEEIRSTPVQQVASAKRSTKTGRKTVRLTPSQVIIAKKLGVPLEEYAKQLNITKEV
jgi:ATP-dependent protease HslVU (ClpYQ) peptidase subunit